MNAEIMALIQDYHGYAYMTAGLILAFFSSARQAQDCARRLQTLSNKPTVEISGSQLTLSPVDF